MRKIIFILSILAFIFGIFGCATGSTRIIGDVSTYKSESCEIKVYPTKEKAIEAGLTKEICIVDGSSAFSFDHSIEGAVKNNISKICKCGVSKAYISSAHTESEMGLKSVSYVNLVGFQ